MKKLKINAFVTLIFLLVSLTSFSQNEKQSSSTQINPIKIPLGLQHSNDEINQDEWNLVDYQFKVDEIQIKIDWVKSNPEETAKANAENWFETAYKILAATKYERDTHIEKYMYKKIPGFPQYINTGNKEQDNADYEKNLSEWINAHPLTSKDHSQ